jgi:hypothetical protein
MISFLKSRRDRQHAEQCCKGKACYSAPAHDGRLRCRGVT